MNQYADRNTSDGSEIAVIGFAARLPGGPNVAQFWRNLTNGIESCRPIAEDEFEMAAIGTDPRQLAGYVNAASMLDDVEYFDHAFFNYSPAEAEVMDPQHRLFLECAWHSLESAGYGATTGSRVGVFAGARTDTYLMNVVNAGFIERAGAIEIGIGNDLGFLSTRVSHRLNLRGPSLSYTQPVPRRWWPFISHAKAFSWGSAK